MKHNNHVTFLYFEGNDFISAISAAQILSLKLAYNFLLLNSLVTRLCNSSACFSFTLTQHPVFLFKNL